MTSQHGDAIHSDSAAEIVAGPPIETIPPRWFGRMLARAQGVEVLHQVGWVTGSYMFGQAMRLATSVVLAKILAPQLFGIMLIINTLRTGFELLSDIGISHNIISNPRGSEPAFFNTAFTLQAIRGFALGILAFVIAGPIVRIYDRPELTLLVPLMSILFILSGLQAPSRFLMMKHGQVKAYAFTDIILSIGSLAVNVGLAFYTPTIWALFTGLIVTALLQTLLTHVLMERGALKFCLEPQSVKQIVSFGKWVFVSSLTYFLAMNYDRLYFAKAIPFAVLGVYGVARTFSDAAGQLVHRIGEMLIFPKISAMQQDGPTLRALLTSTRRRMLLLVASGLAVAIAVSDRIIIVLYDQRYHAAAFMLPILLASIWFAILATLGDSVLMGTRRPAHAARANMLKFLFTCVGLPIALHLDGMVAALFVIATADMVRYISQAGSSRSQQLSFLRQDAMLTLALIAMVVVWRSLFTAAGLVPSLAVWWSYGSGLHANVP
jgi:O-antigen/teichoic acid export membrane protein